jgi:hypothetical protein
MTRVLSRHRRKRWHERSAGRIVLYNLGCLALMGIIGINDLDQIVPDSNRPAEQWFMGINPGDTPENNEFAKVAMGWIEQFEAAVAKA